MNKKIVDELENPIESIRYIKEIYPYKYKFPKIMYNVFEDLNADKNPIIRELRSIQELNGVGFVLCSIPVPKSQRWYYHQMSRLVLRKIGSVGEKVAKKCNSLPNRKGDSHKILYDAANLRIKLIGRRTNPSGESQWFKV